MRVAVWLLAALLGMGGPAEADPAPVDHPRIALIIDDLGQNLARDRRVLALPGPVTLAILPDTPHAAELARDAHAVHKTVILHLPMDPAGGPFAWHPQLPIADLAKRLDAALAAVPYAEGVNNHMGSRMTEQPEAMAWLMGELQRRHLYFVDSRTSARTVAAAEAQKAGLASLSRDVFLDDDQSTAAIARQFALALALARKQGSAVMIGHPHPATLAFLEQALPQLQQQQGIEWIGLDPMIALRGNRAMAAHGQGGLYR
jgi:hypothetical protein